MTAFDHNEFENYKTEVKERWAKTDAYKEHEEKTKNYSKQKCNDLAGEMNNIMLEFACCMKNSESNFKRRRNWGSVSFCWQEESP